MASCSKKGLENGGGVTQGELEGLSEDADGWG